MPPFLCSLPPFLAPCLPPFVGELPSLPSCLHSFLGGLMPAPTAVAAPPEETGGSHWCRCSCVGFLGCFEETFNSAFASISTSGWHLPGCSCRLWCALRIFPRLYFICCVRPPARLCVVWYMCACTRACELTAASHQLAFSFAPLLPTSRYPTRSEHGYTVWLV